MGRLLIAVLDGRDCESMEKGESTRGERGMDASVSFCDASWAHACSSPLGYLISYRLINVPISGGMKLMKPSPSLSHGSSCVRTKLSALLLVLAMLLYCCLPQLLTDD